MTEATVTTKPAERNAWGASFDPDRLAHLELRMWQAHYRGQPPRLFGLLIEALHEQAGAPPPPALVAPVFPSKGAAGLSKARRAFRRVSPHTFRGDRNL